MRVIVPAGPRRRIDVDQTHGLSHSVRSFPCRGVARVRDRRRRHTAASGASRLAERAPHRPDRSRGRPHALAEERARQAAGRADAVAEERGRGGSRGRSTEDRPTRRLRGSGRRERTRGRRRDAGLSAAALADRRSERPGHPSARHPRGGERPLGGRRGGHLDQRGASHVGQRRPLRTRCSCTVRCMRRPIASLRSGTRRDWWRSSHRTHSSIGSGSSWRTSTSASRSSAAESSRSPPSTALSPIRARASRRNVVVRPGRFGRASGTRRQSASRRSPRRPHRRRVRWLLNATHEHERRSRLRVPARRRRPRAQPGERRHRHERRRGVQRSR
jgi:hypothetical protein